MIECILFDVRRVEFGKLLPMCSNVGSFDEARNLRTGGYLSRQGHSQAQEKKFDFLSQL
jgi:hypothetical protein